jgi:hypothetical protein
MCLVRQAIDVGTIAETGAEVLDQVGCDQNLDRPDDGYAID